MREIDCNSELPGYMSLVRKLEENIARKEAGLEPIAYWEEKLVDTTGRQESTEGLEKVISAKGKIANLVDKLLTSIGMSTRK
jgi:hypothetical protein